MAKSLVKCSFCTTEFEKENGSINRARKDGKSIYCGRKCSGLARRLNKSDEQKKIEKASYDRMYRKKNNGILKVKKAEYFKRTYDPEKARIERKKRANFHTEYCRRPEYRKWKREYDRKYRAKKHYGEFWESFLLTLDIRTECLQNATDYEIRQANQTLNKAQTRKRNEHIKRY